MELAIRVRTFVSRGYVFVLVLLVSLSAYHARAEDPKPAATPPPVNPATSHPARESPANPTAATGTEPVSSGTPAQTVEQTGPKPALRGYCPAAYLLQQKAVKGDPSFSSAYHGELYFLSSAEAKEKFDADPERFLPQFTGLCTTALGGSYGYRHESDPTKFITLSGKVYLFTSPRAKDGFDKRQSWYIARAMERFNEPGLKGYCPVAYSKRGEALKGRSNVTAAYRGWLYHFVSEAYRDEFLADPQAFLPQFDGYCTEGVSRGKRYPADPEHFFVKDGKTYFLYDAKTKMTFLTNPGEYIQKADEQWKTLKDAPKSGP